MPSVARVTKKGSKPRSKTDFYPTKQEFADGHVSLVVDKFTGKFKYNYTILDVGFGEGIYANSINKKTHVPEIIGIDIDKSNLKIPNYYDYIYEEDFLIHSPKEKYDIILGNPPYYEIQKFFEKAIDLITDDGVVSFLVKSSYLESAIRFDWFKKHRPYEIWQSVNRPINNHAESYVVVNYKKIDYGKTTFGWLLSTKKEFKYFE